MEEVSLTKRLDAIAFWLEGRARTYRAEARAAVQIGADKRVYNQVADDNLQRARTIREAIASLPQPPQPIETERRG